MRETLFTQLQSAPLLLQDPYRAVARVFLRTVTHQDPRHEAELSKCASALESLRKIQIRKAEDVSSCLALGLSLMTFQRLISGASASTICRYTLSLVQPWYQTVWDDPRISMELTCLVLFDTVQSLFRRRVPVLRYRVRDPFMVDRNVGACASLLPLLYDLCVLGASVCGEGHEHAPPNTSFGQLQRAIADWMPVFQEDTLRDFSDAETLLLMTQARLHRSAALLSLHRLQHPFGERDEEAAIISRSMMIELITCQTVAGRLPPNMVFPILVAGAEAVDLHDRHRIRFLISAINGAAFYPFISNLHGLLAGIWASRGSSDGQFLFDLFDRFPHVSVLL